jgi:hypothetical protein
MKKKGFKKFFGNRFVRNSDSKSVSSAHSRGTTTLTTTTKTTWRTSKPLHLKVSQPEKSDWLLQVRRKALPRMATTRRQTASKKSTLLIEMVASGDSSKQNSVRFAKTPGELQEARIGQDQIGGSHARSEIDGSQIQE